MAAPHLQLGKAGEGAAVAFLRQRGCEILERNYRWSRAEVDIIAFRQNLMHFVEVKTRHWQDVEAAAESVGYKQQRRIMSAAGRYMDDAEYEGDFQFDIIVVLVDAKGQTQIVWREDAFGFWD